MDLVGVAVEPEGIDSGIGLGKVDEVFAGEEGRQTVLPDLMIAFDLPLGLGSRGIAEGDAVEAECVLQLGGPLAGEEEAMEVDVDLQRQTVQAQCAGEKVEVGEEVLGLVDAGLEVEPGAIVEEVEQRELAIIADEPTVWSGVVLPEFPDTGALPAAHGCLDALRRLAMSQSVFAGPAANGGAVEVELAKTMHLGSGEGIGGRWLGGESLAQQGADLGGKLGAMIAPGSTRSPSIEVAAGADTEELGVELVEAGASQAQAGGGGDMMEVAFAKGLQGVADQGKTKAMDQLAMGLFTTMRMEKRWRAER